MTILQKPAASPSAPPSPQNAAPLADSFEGRGGSYRFDPVTGQTTLIECAGQLAPDLLPTASTSSVQTAETTPSTGVNHG